LTLNVELLTLVAANMSSWFGRPSVNLANGLNLRALKVDEAYVNFTRSALDQHYFVYTLSEDCDKCPYKRTAEITDPEQTFVVSTFRSVQLKVFGHNHGPYEFNNK
jgi:heparan-alpha-glucosaminide N-acetyltransferase